jgi:hypothetical protein
VNAGTTGVEELQNATSKIMVVKKFFAVIFLGIELISRIEAISRAVRCGIQK